MSFLAIYAYAIIGTVNIFKRYYNNLFTDEGYLTFTLPVKSSQIFGAKILSAIAWLLLIGIVEALCFCLFMITALPTYAISSLLNNFGQMITTAAEAVGVFQLVIYIIEIIVASLATVIYQIVLVYMSITFATIIAKKHRMITGVLMYFVSNMLVSILITVLAAITTVISSAFFTADSLTHEIISAEMHVQLIQFFLLYGGAATGIYFFNSFLLKKKLNLP